MIKNEIPSIEGFTPDKLGTAIKVANSLDLNALVLRGMALSVHDTMLALHIRMSNSRKKYHIEDKLCEDIQAIGWDIERLKDQDKEHPFWPENSVDNVTVEIKKAGKGIKWHTDVIEDEGEGIVLPFGFGVSVNLVDRAQFGVEDARHYLDIAEGEFTTEDRDRLIDQSKGKGLGEITQFSQAELGPGDVIIWKQPLAHCSSVYKGKSYPKNELRRAFTFIAESTVVPVDVEIS